jgi:flagellar biosynthetic protein FlhB
MPGTDRSQRTEPPTPKRKKEARKRGQVAKTPELATWVGLLAATFLLELTFKTGMTELDTLLARMTHEIAHPTTRGAVQLLGRGLQAFLVTVAPLALGLMVVGVTLELAQIGGRPSFGRMKPKFERLNLFKGLKRILSTRSLWETLKAVLKVAIVAMMAYPSVIGTVHQLAGGGLTALQATAITGKGAIEVVRSAALAGLALAAADYIVQKRRVMAELRMTKQEVREELRQSEGDPHMRQSIRSRQLAIGRNRMIAAVTDADVVIVNPTHYAVALRYQAERGAPEVVAKGAGAVALGIRGQAEAKGVPIIEDQPLARTLHRACEVGDLVPPELYEAVARVLAFVFGLRKRGFTGGVHPSVGPMPHVPAGATDGVLERPRHGRRRRAPTDGRTMVRSRG